MIIRYATIQDLIDFMRDIRPLDKKEAEMSLEYPLGSSRLKDLSHALVLVCEDKIMALGGIQDDYRAWCLCTRYVEDKKYTYKFLRAMKRYLNHLLTTVPYLHNYAWKGNPLHIKWLSFMGATFTERTEDSEFIDFYFDGKKGVD